MGSVEVISCVIIWFSTMAHYHKDLMRFGLIEFVQVTVEFHFEIVRAAHD